MKKKNKIIHIIYISILMLIVTIFAGPKLLHKNTDKSLDYSPKEFEYMEFSSYKDTEFQTAINSNTIDSSFHNEYYGVSEPVNMSKIQSKYSFIWKDELDSSIDTLKKYLTEEESEQFDIVQSEWEKSIQLNMDFTMDVLQTTGGTGFHPQWLDKYRNIYRYRTLEVKYMSYMLENENVIDNINGGKDEYVFESLQFHFNENQ